MTEILLVGAIVGAAAYLLHLAIGRVVGQTAPGVRRVLRAAGVQPGSIILLHVMYPSRAESMKAVPPLIRALKKDGFRFVTVSQLLSLQEAQAQQDDFAGAVAGDR